MFHKIPSGSLLPFQNVEGLSASSTLGRGSVLAGRKASCDAMMMPAIKRRRDSIGPLPDLPTYACASKCGNHVWFVYNMLELATSSKDAKGLWVN